MISSKLWPIFFMTQDLDFIRVPSLGYITYSPRPICEICIAFFLRILLKEGTRTSAGYVQERGDPIFHFSHLQLHRRKYYNVSLLEYELCQLFKFDIYHAPRQTKETYTYCKQKNF